MPLETHVLPLETHVLPLETHVLPLETYVLPLETHVLPLETHVLPVYFRRDDGNNGTYIEDPYESGIQELSPHHRSKRGIFKDINFRLQAPSVDWRKLLGSESVGAAFGVIMYNMLDLKIGGYYKLFSSIY